MPAPAILTTYVRTLADAMGLADWKVDIRDEACDEQYDAYVTIVPGAKWALIELQPRFLEKSDDEQRHTLVHELMHLHFDECHGVLKRNLEDDPMHRVIENEHLNFMEHGVDAVAAAISKLLPEVPHDTRGAKDRT